MTLKVRIRYLLFFLLSFLMLPVYVTAVQAEEVSSAETTSARVSDGEEYTAERIISAVHEASLQKVPDLDSQVMKTFLEASDAYDQLDEDGLAEIPENTVEELNLVRDRIRESVCISDGIAADSAAWYIRTCVSDGDRPAWVKEQICIMYEGSSPNLLYYKKISYEDIRTGAACIHPGAVSLSFPVPSGYESCVNPGIFTVMDGELEELYPEEDGKGNFIVSGAKYLTDIIVADLPVSLVRIELPETQGVNVGQSITLKITPVPENVTDTYEIVWSSSKPEIVSVSSKGVIRGLKEGTATITAKMKGNSSIKASCKVTAVQGAHTLAPSLTQVMKETKNYILSIDKEPAVGSRSGQ